MNSQVLKIIAIHILCIILPQPVRFLPIAHIHPHCNYKQWQYPFKQYPFHASLPRTMKKIRQLHSRGKKVVFPDIDRLEQIMLAEVKDNTAE